MKKNFLLLLVAFLLFSKQILVAQNIAINSTGTAPDVTAMLDVQSTTKGMLVPRMTTAERIAIASPATGLLVFDNTTGSFWFNSGAGWVELIDNTNNTWTKNGSNVYVNNGENVGIGTTAPAVRFQVDNGTDIANETGGYLELGAPSNPNLAFDNNEIQARNNGSASDLFMQLGGGNVGIGAGNPAVRLEIDGGTDMSGVGGGYLQLGSAPNANLAFDNNEIQARKSTVVSTLYLQNYGGDIQVGSSSGSTADVKINNGKLVKPETGAANMMPLCYGHVSANGTLLSGTSNVTITKGVNTAQYFINCTGITSSSMMMAVSNKVNDPAKISVAYSGAGQAKVVVENFDETDNEFSFIFYNP